MRSRQKRHVYLCGNWPITVLWDGSNTLFFAWMWNNDNRFQHAINAVHLFSAEADNHDNPKFLTTIAHNSTNTGLLHFNFGDSDVNAVMLFFEFSDGHIEQELVILDSSINLWVNENNQYSERWNCVHLSVSGEMPDGPDGKGEAIYWPMISIQNTAIPAGGNNPDIIQDLIESLINYPNGTHYHSLASRVREVPNSSDQKSEWHLGPCLLIHPSDEIKLQLNWREWIEPINVPGIPMITKKFNDLGYRNCEFTISSTSTTQDEQWKEKVVFFAIKKHLIESSAHLQGYQNEDYNHFSKSIAELIFTVFEANPEMGATPKWFDPALPPKEHIYVRKLSDISSHFDQADDVGPVSHSRSGLSFDLGQVTEFGIAPGDLIGFIVSSDCRFVNLKTTQETQVGQNTIVVLDYFADQISERIEVDNDLNMNAVVIHANALLDSFDVGGLNMVNPLHKLARKMSLERAANQLVYNQELLHQSIGDRCQFPQIQQSDITLNSSIEYLSYLSLINTAEDITGERNISLSLPGINKHKSQAIGYHLLTILGAQILDSNIIDIDIFKAALIHRADRFGVDH